MRGLHARLPLKKKRLRSRTPGLKRNKVLMPFIPMSQYFCSILSVLKESRETPIINDLQLLSPLLQLHNPKHIETRLFFMLTTLSLKPQKSK